MSTKLNNEHKSFPWFTIHYEDHEETLNNFDELFQWTVDYMMKKSDEYRKENH